MDPLAFQRLNPALQRSGHLSAAVLGLFTQPSRVVAVRQLSIRFRHITLDAGPAATVQWMPGHRLLVAVSGMKTRAYSPFTIDFEPGRLELLAYLNGDAPAAVWARTLQPDVACRVIGPCRSVQLNELQRPVLLFGDETSFGTALAMRATPRRWANVHFVFEVNDLADSRNVLRQLNLVDVDLIERRTDGAHVADIVATLFRALESEPTVQFVLTGHADALPHLGRALKQRGVAASHLRIKAHWATGKRGMS